MELEYAMDNLANAAKEFLLVTKTYKVLAFSGDLGAVKTTFISSLCKVLNVSETISSPSYSIIQEYATQNDEIIFHIDLYRIKNEREAMDAGIEDCINSNEICMVEWPERALNIFPQNTVFANFEILSENQRKLNISF